MITVSSPPRNNNNANARSTRRRSHQQNEKLMEKKSEEKYKEAKLKIAKKLFKEAAEDLTEAINFKPLPKFHFLRGNCYRHTQDYDRAILDYTIAIDTQEEAAFYLARGKCFRTIGKINKSIADFDRGIDVLSKTPQTTNALPNTALNNSRIQSLDTSTLLPVTNMGGENQSVLFQLYVDRGLSYYEKGDKKMAIENFGKAINLNITKQQNLFKAYFHRGNTLRECGELEASIEDLTKAADLDPKNAAVHNNLGLSFFEKRNYPGAEKRFTLAIENDPMKAM